MPQLVDFLPVDAAAWLEWRVRDKCTIRVDGPPGSGKTALLAAFVETVGDSVTIAGLADDRSELEYLQGNSRHLSLIMPALYVRGGSSDLTHLMMRQMVSVAVADDPVDETWVLLEDLQLAGCRVWASSTATRQGLDADIYIRLGGDPDHRVEMVTFADRPVYWVSNGRIIFRPDQD